MSLHEYAFTIRAVHDGDTFRGDLDLGFFMVMRGVSVRIVGINAPELTATVAGKRTVDPAGEAATLHLIGMLGGQFAPARTRATFGIPGDYLAVAGGEPQCVVRTRIKTGDGDYEKYGRVLAEVTVGSLDVGAQMVADGFAVPFEV